MLEVLIQMAGLILCGVGWKLFKPAGLQAEQTRQVLTSLVYYLLLPGLVLSVLWKADLGAGSAFIALAAALGVVCGLLFGMLSCRMCSSQPKQAGAIILAAAFPNATYMGLPVLEATFGSWARGVAIQYDLFACTPLLFTAGILVATRFGDASGAKTSMIQRLIRIPPLWAAVTAVCLNLGEVPQPSVIRGLLELLERGVVPLMLISLGLSLSWNKGQLKSLPTILPVIAIRFLIIPLVVLAFASLLGMSGEFRAAVVMEAAMPSMVLGIVLCDRFKLDVGLYATAVTITTVLSMLVLPLWFNVLTG